MISTEHQAIVLIDDNPDDTFLNRLVIKKSNHPIQTIEFHDPIIALEAFSRKELPENCLILLDVNMPFLNGFEFLEKYKELEQVISRRDTIVILTTSLQSRDRKTAEENKLVHSFMTKPLTVSVFNGLMESMRS